MKMPLFVRAAKDWNARNGAYRVEGSKTYRPEALTDGSGNPLTTVHLKIEIEIPDATIIGDLSEAAGMILHAASDAVDWEKLYNGRPDAVERPGAICLAVAAALTRAT